MRIAIRADSSVRIGTGHIGRTLALAEELKRAGSHVEYVCRDLPGQASFLASDRGFPVRLLPASAEFTEAEDAASTLACLPLPPDAVIVDHYELGKDWEERIRPETKHLIAVDDLANRAHGCDILIDPSLHLDLAQRYQSKVPSSCRLLLGPAYALLRREFFEARNQSTLRETLNNILVFFGGTDESNETINAVEALRGLNLPAVKIEVVLGRTNPHHAEVERAVKNLPNAQLYVQPQDFVQIMKSADLFLGAAGGTTWERACLGVPTLCAATAANQVATAELLARDGFHFYLGKAEEISVAGWQEAIRLRARHWGETLKAGEKSATLVDGRGAEKITQAILRGLAPEKA